LAGAPDVDAGADGAEVVGVTLAVGGVGVSVGGEDSPGGDTVGCWGRLVGPIDGVAVSVVCGPVGGVELGGTQVVSVGVGRSIGVCSGDRWGPVGEGAGRGWRCDRGCGSCEGRVLPGLRAGSGTQSLPGV